MSRDPNAHDMEYWSENEYQLFQDMRIPEEAQADFWVQMLYDMALFSPNETYEVHVAARRELESRLYDVYGIRFEDEFDWEAYKLMGESDA